MIGKKKKTIPDYMYVKRRFPPDHPIHKQNNKSDAESESDKQDFHSVIPARGKADVEYVMVDSIPGLSIQTRSIQSWTPVAARTRANLKKK